MPNGWEWSEQCQVAFDKLKEALVSTKVLVHPNFNKPFVIATDASSYAVSAVLSQMHEDGEHPIYYASKALSKTQRKYDTRVRECLSIVFAFRVFRPWIEGAKFTVYTDHLSLK